MQIEIQSCGKKAIVYPAPAKLLLAIADQLEGPRRWLKGGGMTMIATTHNIDLVRNTFNAELVDRRGNEEFDISQPKEAYKQKTEPYEHQIRALRKSRLKRTFALFMEQGTGKTKVAIDLAGERYCSGEIDAVLVVAKKGVHRQWLESQIPEHLGVEWCGHYWESQKIKKATASGKDGLHWFAINYDGANTPKGYEACIEFLRKHQGKVMIIADETQEIKNSRSARYKAINKLKDFAGTNYRLILTGTPIAKDLTDEWAQLKWLNENIIGIRYVTAFRGEYCVMGGYKNKVVVGHKKIEKFKRKVEPYSFRATKDDIGIMPKVYRRWSFDLSQKQIDAIKSIKSDLRLQFESGEIHRVATATVALMKVQQISNNFFIDAEGKNHQVVKKSPRIAALVDILKAYEEQTIIWTRYREDIRQVKEALENEAISFVEYHGGTGEKERAKAIDSFLSQKARVFLSNPQAGGTGLNLQGACRHAIYYSNSFNAIDRWQSEDRIHRIGSNGAIVYTDLICKGALDEHILRNLKKKKGISDLALDDIKDWAYED